MLDWFGARRGNCVIATSCIAFTMASSYDDAMLGEHGHGDHSHDYHAQDMPPHADSNWQNGGQIYRTRTPDNGSYRPRPPASAPGTPNPPGWAEDQPPRKSAERNRSRGRSGRSASGQTRTCQACGEPLTGQFVRALDGTFHLDCFKCQVRTPRPALFSSFTARY